MKKMKLVFLTCLILISFSAFTVPKASAANIDIEDNDVSSSANYIAVDVTYTDLTSDDEYDCFNFTVYDQFAYEVILDSDFAAVDLDLQLYNSNAQLIGISDTSNNREYIRVNINVQEIVTIKVYQYSSGAYLTTLYNLSVIAWKDDGFEQNDNFAQARHLVQFIPQSIEGLLFDDDFFYINQVTGENLNIQLDFEYDGINSLNMTIYDEWRNIINKIEGKISQSISLKADHARKISLCLNSSGFYRYNLSLFYFNEIPDDIYEDNDDGGDHSTKLLAGKTTNLVCLDRDIYTFLVVKNDEISLTADYGLHGKLNVRVYNSTFNFMAFLSDFYSPGTMNYSFTANVTEKLWILIDYDYDIVLSYNLTLNYTNNVSPTITLPSDVQFTIGETANIINWTIIDNRTENTNYKLYRNNTLVASGVWSSGNTISYNLDELSVGIYEFRIEISDGLGGTIVDSVVVVVEDKPFTGIPGFQFEFISIGCLVGVILATISERKKKLI